MDVTNEIEAIKKVVECLTSLDEAARIRVMEYASKMLNISGFTQSQASESESGRKPVEDRKSQGSGKPTGPQEYLRKFDYKVMTKRIAVMAVYLEREKSEKRFSLKAITAAFKDAKEPKPPAYSQYNRAVAMNYLAKDGALYYATSQAEELVDLYKSRQTPGKVEESE